MDGAERQVASVSSVERERERERESPPLPGYAGMFQCLTPIDRPCVGTRCIVWPYTQAAVCLTVRLRVSVSVSVSVCLCQCLASLHRLTLYSSSRVSHGPSQCQCQGLSLIASYGFTQANVCDTVHLSVSVSVSVCDSYCIVLLYSSQRL